MNGYSAFPLGGVDHECFCGWEYSSNFCIPPSEVCLGVTNSSSCPYKLSDQEVWVSNALKMWSNSNGWSCPDMDLSDSWGIVTNNHAQVIYFVSLLCKNEVLTDDYYDYRNG